MYGQGLPEVFWFAKGPFIYSYSAHHPSFLLLLPGCKKEGNRKCGREESGGARALETL